MSHIRKVHRSFQLHIFLSLVWWCLLLDDFRVLVNAAHARKRVVAVRNNGNEKYDRSISTFNDEGRLLQVEYAMECTKRGSTTVCMCWNDSMVMIVPSCSPQVVHRIHHGTLMATTGLQGDGRALAKALIETFASQHEEEMLPSVEEIARTGASFQHELTLLGGSRPMGVMAAFVGIDDDKRLQLFQTEPGGAIYPCHFCAAGKYSSNPKLLQNMDKIYDDNNAADPSSLSLTSSTIQQLSETVLDILQENETNDDIPHLLDIYVMKTNPNIECRGGVTISCAKKVQLADLPMVAKRLTKT